MKVEVDTKTVFASPFDGFQEVRPADFGEERLAGIDLDGPERKGNTDPVETSGGDLSKVFLRDECCIVVLDGVEVTVAGLDERMEGPFIDGGAVEWFI